MEENKKSSRPVILLGGPPSSGSTMIAGLLDSSTSTACGPELEFFCNPLLYDFQTFKENPSKTGELFTLGATDIFPRYNRLKHFGLDHSEFKRMIQTSESLHEFYENFTAHFLGFRDKRADGIVLEKTPQNINCLEPYLDSHPKAHFIFIVRNPIYVFNSLTKRGFGPYRSMAIWLTSVAKWWSFRYHERVSLLRYEDVVEDPFGKTANTLNEVCSDLKIDPEQIQRVFNQNDYRKEATTSFDTWSQKSANEILNANRQNLPQKILEAFQVAYSSKVNPEFAERWNLSPVSYAEACEFLGYDDQIMTTLDNLKNERRRIEYGSEDLKKLLLKWIRNFRKGNVGLKDLPLYFKALEIDSQE